MEIIDFKCNSCNKAYKTKVLDHYKGKHITLTCPNCKNKSIIFIPVSVQKEKISQESNSQKKNDQGVKIFQINARILVNNTLGSKKQSFLIKFGENIVGRKTKGNTIDIPIETNDRFMGRKHCIIVARERNDSKSLYYTLKELDAKNKIILNGRLVESDEEILLAKGDELILGTTKILFETNE